ncbi:two-component system sensor histidine kinase SenX3 [Friedmanniella endophytica]|uniref:Sensor-like histidine kinase SenX3 n=1 Tax=Microlunatus kandeliicorticis TaxID=1759536 RepID=A0A7W3P7Q4_9ACTN|nr:ATP-binding protein [Microlunatus kandeliicorticis]MBA8796259.1 two-component system sensor histidine kinase SenX3 [Microlunatus kandeliicorticis]
MNPGVVAVIGASAGLVVGILLTLLVLRLRRAAAEQPVDPTRVPVLEPPRPTPPAGTTEVLAVLRSCAVIIGPDEEVVDANGPARRHRLVRGTRMVNEELAREVGVVRTDRRARELDLVLGTGPGAVHLATRVLPLGADFVLVLAEDRSAEYRVDETRRDFVANVSHELKTPIGAVALLAEALEGASDDPDAVRRFAGRLTVESRRLTTLVGQIIDLSRLQADDPLLEPEVVPVDRVLASAVDASRVEADRRGVTLTVAGTTGLQLLGSERQLTTAVGNLVENAVVYSDSGARVVVAARAVPGSSGQTDAVELTVSDNGIGIPAADQQRIFERFYRVDYARSRDNGGTGLGLSIVKHVVAAHHGRLSLWSQLGRGSTFTLRLPAHHPDQPQPAPEAAADVTPVGTPPAAPAAPVTPTPAGPVGVTRDPVPDRSTGAPTSSRRSRTARAQEATR